MSETPERPDDHLVHILDMVITAKVLQDAGLDPDHGGIGIGTSEGILNAAFDLISGLLLLKPEWLVAHCQRRAAYCFPEGVETARKLADWIEEAAPVRGIE